MREWPAALLRGIGVVDILFGFVGVDFITHSFLDVAWGGLVTRVREPYLTQVLWVDLLVEAVLVLAIFPTGVWVARLEPRGLFISCVLFSAQSAWAYGSAILLPALLMQHGKAHLLGMSIGAAYGVGHMGTAPQDIVFYPVWGLVLTILAYAKLPRQPSLPRRLL